MEEWRSVVGYEGYYEVSSFGGVRSVEREIVKSNGVVQVRHAQVKKTHLNDDGYVTVKLSKDGDDKRVFVHRIVYEAFAGAIPDGYEINHIDFDRTNNNIENLEVVSHTENIRYTYLAGRHYVTKTDLTGQNNPNYGNRKLSEVYRANPELSRIKQGRPGLQNGRCQKIVAEFPDGSEVEYGCIKQCAQDLIDSGISKGTATDVYVRIYNSMRKGVRYKNIRFKRI